VLQSCKCVSQGKLYYFIFIVVQEKFGAAWTFVATTFLNEFDKNFYEVIILLCIVFCIVVIDFCLIIHFHIAHAFRFDHKFT